MKTRETDMEVVRNVLAGDTGAFSHLVDRYGDMVYSLVRRTIGDGDEAQDVTQDIFVKVYSSLGKYNAASSFSTWLYRVAYNSAVSHMRKNNRRPSSMEESHLPAVADDDMEGLFRKAAEEKRYGDLEAALSKLTGEERALVTLFYMDDRPVNDISEITGISVTNVKVKLHRIRKKLFVLMGGDRE